MKKSIWTIALGGFAALLLVAASQPGAFLQAAGKAADKAPAAASPPVIDEGLASAQAPSSLFVTVYGNRFAQVEQTRRVHLPAGANRILVDGIATHYRPDSLRIIDARLAASNVLKPKFASKQLGKAGKPFTYLSATYQPANLTAEKLLQASLGKRVSIANAEQKVEGVLLSVSGTTAIVKSDDGKTSVIPAASATVSELPKGLSNTAALVVECWADVEGDYDLDFIYDTDGISWTAKHSLIYDDDKSVVESWETTVAIENNSGTSFHDATVSLLPGKVLSESGEGRMYAARSYAPGAASLQDAAVNSLGDQTVYTLPEKTVLLDGQSRQVPLFRACNLPVKREYFIPANSAGYYSHGKQEVSIRLELENCEKNNLGKPLPAGSLRVYQHSGKTDKRAWNAPNPVQLVGSAQIGAKAVDEVFQVVIGTASDIKWERLLVDSKQTTAPVSSAAAKVSRPLPAGEAVWEARTYKINVYNFKRDRAVDVTVEVSFPTDQAIASPWLKKGDISQAQSKLTVPASGQCGVEYLIKERVR